MGRLLPATFGRFLFLPLCFYWAVFVDLFSFARFLSRVHFHDLCRRRYRTRSSLAFCPASRCVCVRRPLKRGRNANAIHLRRGRLSTDVSVGCPPLCWFVLIPAIAGAAIVSGSVCVCYSAIRGRRKKKESGGERRKREMLS